MQFISSGSSDISDLLKVIDPDNLPKEYGGELDYMPPTKKPFDDIMTQLKPIPKKNYIEEGICRSDKFQKVINVNENSEGYGKYLEYEFKTTPDDIIFSVTFQPQGSSQKPEKFYECEKFNSHEIPVFGRIFLNKVGNYNLCWTNDSFIRSKKLFYSTKIF